MYINTLERLSVTLQTKVPIIVNTQSDSTKKFLNILVASEIIKIEHYYHDSWVIRLTPGIVQVQVAPKLTTLRRTDVAQWSKELEDSEITVLLVTVQGVYTLKEALTLKIGGRVLGYVQHQSDI